MSSAAIRGGRVAIEIGADAKKFYAALNALQSRIRSIGSSIAGVGTRLAGVGTAAVAPFGLAIAQTAAFQDTMAAVGAVTDATGDDFNRLKQKALDLGASTSFTAQQVAEGMQALGQGGFSVEETLAGIDGTLLLARAGMLDLGTATSIAVSVLRSFKMPTEEAGKVADILAKAANSSNASVSDLGEALSTVGGIAYTAGVSLTELTAAAGLLADRGMAGSEAGTALRRVLIGLAQERDKLKDLGVEIEDPKTGKLKPLKQILDELRVAMQGMSETDKIAKLSKIFDVFGANAVLQLMNAGDALGELDTKLQNSGGSAEATAKKMDDTLGGAMRMLMSAVEGVSLAVGEALTKELRSWLDYMTRIASGLGKAVASNQEWIVSAFKAAAATIAAGGALVGLGVSLQLVAFGVGGFAKALAVVAAPLAMLLRTSSLVTASFASAGRWVSALANTTIAMAAFGARTAAVSVQYTALLTRMAAITAARLIAVGAAWAAAGVAATFAFIAHIKALVTYYTGALAGMVAITITRMGQTAAAYVGMAGVAVSQFVAVSIGGLASYVASLAGATAATVTSAATMASAWLAPVAPIVGLGAAIAGIGVAMQSTLSSGGSVASTIGSLFGPLSAGFSQVLSDATAVFSDLWGVASGTFKSISDAITAGDMSLAFDVLWAGLSAAWLRGQQGVMSYVDVFVEYLQNRWGDAVTWIAQAMTRGLGIVERAWIKVTGSLYQNFLIAINRVMNVWDIAVGAIQKAIAYIRSFFDDSIDYEAVKKQIDAANEERRKARDKDEVDAARSTKDKAERSKDIEDGAVQMLAEDNSQAQAQRAERTAARAGDRQGAVDAANADLAMTQRRADAAAETVDIAKAIDDATSPDELRELWSRAQELFDAGLIAAERLDEISQKIDDQSSEMDKTRAMKAQEDDRTAKDKADAEAAASAVAQEKDGRSTEGTISSFAAAFLGGGSSVAERTAKAAEETARNTRKIGSGRVQP